MFVNNNFDAQKSEELKNEGIARAISGHKGDLELARKIAKTIAESNESNECDADKVQAVLIDMNINLGNAAGGLFRGKGWDGSGLAGLF
jgi:hypothetical protein